MVGCSTAPTRPPRHDFPDTIPFPGSSYDIVWTAIIDGFATIGFPIDNLEKDSGIVVTDWMSIDSSQYAYLDCGSPGKKSGGVTRRFQDPLAKFNVILHDIDEGPEMKVNTFYQADWCENGDCTQWTCESTGVFERDFMYMVQGEVFAD